MSTIQKNGMIGLFLGFGLLVGMGGVWGAVESTGRKLGGEAFFGEVDRKGIHRVTGNAGAGLVWYVDAGAGPAGDGMSWETAFVDLQDGLGVAAAGDEIRVAEGVYVPTGDGDRGVSFVLKTGVSLFGGFPSGGDEDSDAYRDREEHETILSGDLNGDDEDGFMNNGENSFHVLRAEGVEGVGLEGFTVRGGNADNSEVADGMNGGGILVNGSSSVVMSGCVFMANRAGRAKLSTFTGHGGAIYAMDSALHLNYCRFEDNLAGTDSDFGGGLGGAIYSDAQIPYSKLEITHCQFLRNRIGSGSSFMHRGGALWAEGIVSITHSHFDENSAWFGGAIILNEAIGVVFNCSFTNNIALAPYLIPEVTTYGGAMFITRGNTTIANSTFEGNHAVQGGAINYSDVAQNGTSGATLVNCLLRGNRAKSGGGIVNVASNPIIAHCTIIGNEAELGGGVYNSLYSITNPVSTPSFPTIINSIIWHNRGDSVVDEGDSITTVSFSNMENVFEGDGNISIGPEFMDAEHRDFRLSARSANIDSADPFGLPPDVADLDGDGDTEEPIPFDLNGNPRVMGTGPDMGAFEFGGMSAPPTGSVMKFVDTEGQWDADGSGWDRATPALRAALENAGAGDEILVAEGTYRPTTGTDRTATFHLRDGVALYGGFPSGGGSFESRDSERRETILSGDIGIQDDASDNSFHVVVIGEPNMDHTGMTLDGFTITEGNAVGNDYYSGGGGVRVTWTSSSTIRKCVFLNNRAQFGGGGLMINSQRQSWIKECYFLSNQAIIGGGVRTESSPSVFIDCAFRYNSSSDGGGVYNRTPNLSTVGWLTFINCTFSQNNSNKGGGMYNFLSKTVCVNCVVENNESEVGGGIWILSHNFHLTNCTISGNVASESGGGLFFLGFQSSAILQNCVLRGNTPEQIDSNPLAGIDIHHSNIEGGFIGEGNIDVDPRFVDVGGGDFRLGEGSPCIDAGDTLALPLDEFDLDGDGDLLELIPFDLGWMRRVLGSAVDMGAFEFQGEGDEDDHGEDDDHGGDDHD